MTSIVSTRADDAPGRSWDRLMVAAQAGDANSYRVLLSELAIWLRRYYARRLPPTMTDEAVQEALRAIHENRHTYDPRRSFEPWLTAIARYTGSDRLRSLRFEASEPLDEKIAVPRHRDCVIAGPTLRQLEAELRPLPAAALRVVMLVGYGVDEASRATGQSISFIGMNIHRGIERLTEITLATRLFRVGNSHSQSKGDLL